jgi:hypothetical protein
MPAVKPKSISPPTAIPQLLMAISIRQPWAALIVHGRKTIELRSWPTTRRGTILIHASKTIDDDRRAWSLVDTPEFAATAALSGGVIGQVELMDCITYATRSEFAADGERHRAGPEWFRLPRYGFVFAKPRRVEFIRWPGNTNFFGVRAALRFLKSRSKRPPTPRDRSLVVTLPESPRITRK